MIIDTAAQGTPEWLQARAGVITASNLSKVTSKGRGSAPSLTRETYMIEKATEILTGKPIAEGYKSDAMQRGNDMESEAREYYEMISRNPVEQIGLCYLNELKRIGASVDGLVGDEGLVEIKCPSLAVHVRYLMAGAMPADYVKQVQGQMWITGRAWCDFISYNPDSHKMNFKIRVDRDDEIIKTLEAETYKFIGELDGLVEKLRAM